jgi:hypothetical protein
LTKHDWTEPENGTNGKNKTNGTDSIAKMAMLKRHGPKVRHLLNHPPLSTAHIYFKDLLPFYVNGGKILFPGNKKVRFFEFFLIYPETGRAISRHKGHEWTGSCNRRSTIEIGLSM